MGDTVEAAPGIILHAHQTDKPPSSRHLIDLPLFQFVSGTFGRSGQAEFSRTPGCKGFFCWLSWGRPGGGGPRPTSDGGADTGHLGIGNFC